MRSLLTRLMMIAIGLVLHQLPATAQVISIEPLTLDFGQMQQREERSGSVTVTNNGAGLLELSDVQADCGCTIPSLKVDRLAPGESTTIEIQFNSKKFHGNVVKVVRVYSNDPNRPESEIIITADVTAALIVDPVSQRIGFSPLLRGETLTKSATMTASEAEKLVIEVGDTHRGLFEIATVNNLDGDPQRARVDVTVPVNMAAGRHRDNLRITTNIEETPYVDFELGCWIQEMVKADPDKINFRYKKDLSRTVRVTPSRKGVEYKVTGAEIDLPEIEVTFEEAIPNTQNMVRLSGVPIAKDDPRAVKAKGRISGTLIIYTDLEEVPRLEIPVTYMIRM